MSPKECFVFHRSFTNSFIIDRRFKNAVNGFAEGDTCVLKFETLNFRIIVFRNIMTPANEKVSSFEYLMSIHFREMKIRKLYRYRIKSAARILFCHVFIKDNAEESKGTNNDSRQRSTKKLVETYTKKGAGIRGIQNKKQRAKD